MVTFGYPTNPSKEILGEIRRAKRLGLDFVEIGIEGPCGMPEVLAKKRKQILDLLKKQKMFAIGHTAWWMELGSLYQEVRKAWVKEAKSAIRVANRLNMNVINFHSQSEGLFMLVRKERPKILKNYVSSMKELVRYARQFGIRVMLENTPFERGKPISQLRDIKYILDRVPGLKFHLDVGHANTVGGTPAVLKFINTFKSKLLHLHIHDNNGVKDEHLPLGEGNIEYEKVVRALKKTGFDRTISFEVFFGGDRKFKNSVEKIKKLWKSV